MRNGKYSKRGVASKTLVLILAFVLVIGCSVGATLAFLKDATGPVTNTFTVGDVDITLKETDITNPNDGLQENVKNAYKLLPGQTYTKDPTVTVVAKSEDCYLFVKFEEKNNPSTYIEYTSNLKETDWHQVSEDEPDVWYRVVEYSDKDQPFELLARNTIKIKESVGKDNMADAAKAELVYTAYACQKDNVKDVATAWAEAKTAAAH